MNVEESGGARQVGGNHAQTQPKALSRQSPSAGHPVIGILALTLICLAAFIGKAVHVDDTLFLRAAEQIQKHPANFYGFEMNWYGSTRPMVENFDNPPLACYYLALLAGIGGWSEQMLHLGLILPALAAAAGVFFLARNYTGQPVLATLAAVAMPVFVISATTLMCDLILLALWIWTLVYFEDGLRRSSRTAFLISGLLAGLAFCAKFPGLALVPLLLAYGWVRTRRFGSWLVAPALPLAFVAGYQWITFCLYGKALLLTAAGVSASAIPGASALGRQFVGLSFLGGCFLPTLFYTPWLWSGKSILKGLCVIIPFLLLYPYFGAFSLLWDLDGRPDWLRCLQSALFVIAGVHILLLAAVDFWNHRDATALLLLLWVFGVFVFASVVNWTLNGRSILPMAPAVGILLARRFEHRLQSTTARYSIPVWWAAVPGVGLSLVLAWSDYDLANTGRTAAGDICRRYQRPGNALWFEGHWGFQYYMERNGARALERGGFEPVPGDFITVPSEAVNLFDLPAELVRLVATLDYPSLLPCSTMNSDAGAGFYSATAGPFPWIAGCNPQERYYVFEVTRARSSSSNPSEKARTPGPLIQQFALERQSKACRHALRRNPADLAPRLRLAAIAEQQCQPARAISEYRAALNFEANSDVALMKLAWLLATSGDSKLRNGKEALELARRADELTSHGSPEALMTLAAAYGEQSLFAQAATTAETASALARKNGQKEILSGTEEMLRCYRAERPFHQ